MRSYVWLQGPPPSTSKLLEEREGGRASGERKRSGRFFSPGFQGTPNDGGHQWKPSLPRAPEPLHSSACPHYTIHKAREGKSTLGLGKTQKKGCDLGSLRLHSSPPHTLLPPSPGEFQQEILARESREFSLGSLEESLVLFISLFSPGHLPFPLECSMELPGLGVIASLGRGV